jgi:hypothetical protein
LVEGFGTRQVHAILNAANREAGSTHHKAVQRLTLRFSANIDCSKKRTNIELRNWPAFTLEGANFRPCNFVGSGLRNTNHRLY